MVPAVGVAAVAATLSPKEAPAVSVTAARNVAVTVAAATATAVAAAAASALDALGLAVRLAVEPPPGDGAPTGGTSLVVLAVVGALTALAAYWTYIRLPSELSDRRKLQFFEFGLRIADNYLGEWLEPLIGAVARNRALRFFSGVLFSAQPRPPAWCRVEWTKIANVRCRVYLPMGAHRRTDAAMIYIHGGGFCIMRARYYDSTLVPLVERIGGPLISIDYRLSPEAPFGLAIRQCEAVAYELYDERYKEYGIDRSRIAVIGDSAGGNLATVLVQRFCLQGRPELFRCQVLIYPLLQMLDALLPSYRYYYRAYRGTALLNPRLMARWSLMYLGVEPTAANVNAFVRNKHVANDIRTDPQIRAIFDYSRLPEQFRDEAGLRDGDEKTDNPYKHPPDEELAERLAPLLRDADACPLLADDRRLAGAAPALIVTAGVDVLRDEGALYARRLRDAGVRAEWRHYPRAYHGIIHMPYSRQRDRILDDISAFLSTHFRVDTVANGTASTVQRVL